MLKKRSLQILTYVFENSDGISGNTLANLLDITPRTVRNDIREINEELACLNALIESSPKKGYYLSYDAKKKVLGYLANKDSGSLLPNTPSERQLYIILKIVFAKDIVQIEDLENELYVSKTTIRSDLENMAKLLEKYEIRISSYRGIIIDGKESDIRHLLSKLISKNYNGNLDYLRPLLKKFSKYNEEDYYKICDCLVQILDANKIVITDKDLYIFSYEILLGILRSKDGFTLEDGYVPKNDVLLNIPFDILENSINCKISSSDRIYINNCYSYKRLLSSNYSLISDDLTSNIVDEYFLELKNNYSLDINLDQTLKENLISHINSMIKRIQYKEHTDDMLLADIKDRYPYSFELASVIIPIINKYLDVSISENELIYLAVHLAVILDNTNPKTNIIVICGSGLGTAQLVINRINNVFGNRINVLSYGPSYKISKLLREYSNVNLIITTIPLNINLNIPVVQVSPLLDDKDIKAINSYLNNSNSIDMHDDSNCLDPNLFFVIHDDCNEYDVLKNMVHTLYNFGYINSFSKFYTSVMHREKTYSTKLNKIWLPHPMKSMSKTTVLPVAIMKNDNDIKIIMLLAINAQENTRFQNLYAKITHLIENESMFEKAINCNSFLEFKQLFDIL